MFKINSATVITAVILAAVVVFVIVRLVKNRKKGKCLGCDGCPQKDNCDKK